MKNTFLQSPVIALQHVKNSAKAIEKLYRKTCVRKGLLRVIYTTITRVTQAQFFTPCLDKIKVAYYSFDGV